MVNYQNSFYNSSTRKNRSWKPTRTFTRLCQTCSFRWNWKTVMRSSSHMWPTRKRPTVTQQKSRSLCLRIHIWSCKKSPLKRKSRVFIKTLKPSKRRSRCPSLITSNKTTLMTLCRLKLTLTLICSRNQTIWVKWWQVIKWLQNRLRTSSASRQISLSITRAIHWRFRIIKHICHWSAFPLYMDFQLPSHPSRIYRHSIRGCWNPTTWWCLEVNTINKSINKFYNLDDIIG